MSFRLGATARAAVAPPYNAKPKLLHTVRRQCVRVRVSNGSGSGGAGGGVGGDSYLDMWKRAEERRRKEKDFERIAGNTASFDVDGSEEEEREDLERKSSEFQKILEVSKEERDRAQRMQVIDRAAAAIAAARAILEENPPPAKAVSGENVDSQDAGMQDRSLYYSQTRSSGSETPGPDFWSWTPSVDDSSRVDTNNLQMAPAPSSRPKQMNPLMEKERSAGYLAIPFQSNLSEDNLVPPLPPLQSQMEEEHSIEFSAHSEEAAHALEEVEEQPSYGKNLDGSRWWKDTGVEKRPDGVVCRWTLNRGVSADGVVEWEEKYWEAANEHGHKELGSEKSGRDARGNVWREYWKETMWQERGLLHIEKTADKWGRSGKGDEWQEKWWEWYDASGKADKWAHKWCSIDPNTPVEPGHAHVWHERWGENYDGRGGSTKYTDKWAEHYDGDGWSKWGDKWDERFDLSAHGVKQGETWWEGKHGERWNRTWGEEHNGSGWVHKYGKSSSGEHWDTHVQEDTWYEKFPHYGFFHCFDNSVQLRNVKRPSDDKS